MTIEALKYKTEDKSEIIVCVTLRSEGSNDKLWFISDVKCRPYRKKNFISMETKLREESRNIDNPTFERKQEYIKNKLIEFIGVEMAKRAYTAAWESIKPSTEEIVQGE